MSLKSTDKFIITGKELPIRVDTATGSIVYDKADVVFEAGDWPSYKSTITSAVSAGLIKSASKKKIEVVEVPEVVEESVVEGEE